MLAYEDAAAHFARAAALAADPVPLLLAHGDALLRAGEPGAAAAVFQDAAARARDAGDAEALARAALGHAGLAVTIIELEAASIALLEEALAALGDAQPALRSQLLSRLAVELYYAPSRDRSEALSADAVATRGRPATDVRWRSRSTPAGWRCGGPTACRSGSPPPRR